jgi:hypothetical protein
VVDNAATILLESGDIKAVQNQRFDKRILLLLVLLGD